MRQRTLYWILSFIFNQWRDWRINERVQCKVLFHLYKALIQSSPNWTSSLPRSVLSDLSQLIVLYTLLFSYQITSTWQQISSLVKNGSDVWCNFGVLGFGDSTVAQSAELTTSWRRLVCVQAEIFSSKEMKYLKLNFKIKLLILYK